MVRTYEAVASAVTVPLYSALIRSRPLYEIAVSGFSENISRTHHFQRKIKSAPVSSSTGTPPKPILRNGSLRLLTATQALQLEQHREHPFEFSVEMNLVASEAFEPVRVDRFAKCLVTDQRSIIKLLATFFVPG
jgi:hypothetical protein